MECELCPYSYQCTLIPLQSISVHLASEEACSLWNPQVGFMEIKTHLNLLWISLTTRDVHWFALIRESEANQADSPGSKANPNRFCFSRIKANPNQAQANQPIRFADLPHRLALETI